MGHSLGDELLTLMRCHRYMKPLKGGSLLCGRAYNLNGIKRKFCVFSSLALFLSYCSSFLGMMHADSTVVGGGESLINKYKIREISLNERLK